MCLKKRVPGQGYEYCSTPGKSQGALGPGYPTGYNSTAVVGRVGIISYMTAMMGEGGNEPGCRLWYLAPGTVSLQLVIRAIGVSHTACKDEFRNLRSHSWSVFSFFIICYSKVYRRSLPRDVQHSLKDVARHCRSMIYTARTSTADLSQ